MKHPVCYSVFQSFNRESKLFVTVLVLQSFSEYLTIYIYIFFCQSNEHVEKIFTRVLETVTYSTDCVYPVMRAFTKPTYLRRIRLVFTLDNILVPNTWMNLDLSIRRRCRCPQIFQKYRYHFRILGARSMWWNKFQTKDSQILGSTLQNTVALAT